MVIVFLGSEMTSTPNKTQKHFERSFCFYSGRVLVAIVVSSSAPSWNDYACWCCRLLTLLHLLFFLLLLAEEICAFTRLQVHTGTQFLEAAFRLVAFRYMHFFMDEEYSIFEHIEMTKFYRHK